jgi:hypothetical protein
MKIQRNIYVAALYNLLYIETIHTTVNSLLFVVYQLSGEILNYEIKNSRVILTNVSSCLLIDCLLFYKNVDIKFSTHVTLLE